MTDALSFEQQAYELPEIWDADYFSAEDHARIDELATLVPQSGSLLDVGCGNGLFLNHLHNHYRNRYTRLAGFDRSLAALEHVKVEKKSGSIGAIPFGTDEFDTVTCMEVLEHIPVTVYPQALAEIARIAKDNIVISVPYRQDLKASLTECPSCCARFNADFHVRSYDEDAMRSLFALHRFEPVRLQYLGKGHTRYDHLIRNSIREFFKKPKSYWWPYAICPVCGFSDRAALTEELAEKKRARSAKSEAAVAVPGWRRFLRDIMPKRTEYRWVLAIYRRA